MVGNRGGLYIGIMLFYSLLRIFKSPFVFEDGSQPPRVRDLRPLLLSSRVSGLGLCRSNLVSVEKPPALPSYLLLLNM